MTINNLEIISSVSNRFTRKGNK